MASLEGHVLLKKLRDALESLRGRLAGRNKEDVEKAISMVSFILFPYSVWFTCKKIIFFPIRNCLLSPQTAATFSLFITLI